MILLFVLDLFKASINGLENIKHVVLLLYYWVDRKVGEVLQSG